MADLWTIKMIVGFATRPVRWFAESRLFMCPCHGGVYYEDGSVASGPPPEGLYQYAYRVTKNTLIRRAASGTPARSSP